MTSRFGLRHVLVFLVVGSVLGSAGTGLAGAQSAQGVGGTVIVDEGETIDRIDGVYGTIIVRGTVDGDISGAAGTIHITDTGTVRGGIDAAAGTIKIDGAVSGELNVAGGSIEITESAVVNGDMNAGASYTLLDGTIGGDVQVGADTFVIGPNANIDGSVRFNAASFTQDPEATVTGSVVRDDELGGTVGPDFSGLAVPRWFGTIYGLLANFVLGALLLLVFPDFSNRVASRVAREPLWSGGIGLLVLIGVPIVLVLIAITIIGIPLALLGILGFIVAVWVAGVYGQFAVGDWALGRLGQDNHWLSLIVGLVGFAILGLIPVIGGLFAFGALLLGLGALTVGFRDVYRAR